MNYRYTLEKYKGRDSRHACPSCGRDKEFVRYVDAESGDHLAAHVGRCNREAGCGYHYKPKQFFAENPASQSQTQSGSSEVPKKSDKTASVERKSRIDLIPIEIFRETLAGYKRNAFVRFLRQHFSLEEVQLAIERYFIGTWSNSRTVFWQIDAHRRVRTGKLMVYDATTGRRLRDRKPSWVHADLKRAGAIAQNFNLRQCLFGEHLIPLAPPEKVVGIVESEKTAVVASITIPVYVWVATGGAMNLRPEQLRSASRGHRIVLFPDSSKFEAWSEKAVEARRVFGLNVRVSDLLERRLTAEEKRRDRDIADYLLVERMNKKV